MCSFRETMFGRGPLRLVLPLLLSTHAVADSTYSFGTGFFVTTDGYIATNYHVVKGASSVHFRDSKGRMLPARVLHSDVSNDISVLKVEGVFSPLPVANSRTVKPGTQVVTMGYPMITIQGGEPKITDGIVNSLSGVAGDLRLFQVSVPVQPGNSGGPLVNRDGNVVGIIASRLDSLGVLARTGDLPQNVNYAIKSNYLLEVLASIPDVEKKLMRPRVRRIPDLEGIAVLISQSIGIVVAEIPSPETPTTDAARESGSTAKPSTVMPDEKVKAREFPPLWWSTTTGRIYRARTSGRKFYFELASQKFSGEYIIYEVEVLENQTGHGVIRGIATCGISNIKCPIHGTITVKSISADRIEGSVSMPGTFDNCNTCAAGQYSTHPFAWIPYR